MRFVSANVGATTSWSGRSPQTPRGAEESPPRRIARTLRQVSAATCTIAIAGSGLSRLIVINSYSLHAPALSARGVAALCPSLGTRLGVYDFRSLIGAGGMGDVYRHGA